MKLLHRLCCFDFVSDIPGNTELGSITVDFLFDWFGISCMTNDNFLFLYANRLNSKPVKQEVNGTMILPPLVFPGYAFTAATLYIVGEIEIPERT
jgi:hypothetical protein